MTATIKSPFRELMALQDRMNRMFDSEVPGERSGEEIESAAWTPTVDIYETKENIVVNVEAPGMSREQFGVEVKDDILSIRGERPFEKDVTREQYHRIERAYGKFRRSFVLGVPINVDGISATYKDGVLEINLPKVEETRSKKVEIS
jgi:HSP20 family protein